VEDGELVELGVCDFLHVNSFLPDMDDLLERMDDHVSGDFGFCEDPVFEVDPKNAEEAKAELEKVLQEWAAKWVEVAVLFTMITKETIVLGNGDQGDPDPDGHEGFHAMKERELRVELPDGHSRR
jgi:hypothetical protein